MIDYDYLDWGVGLPIEDDFKKIEYREQAKVKLFEVDPDEVLYEEGKEENDYDVWYLQLPTEKIILHLFYLCDKILSTISRSDLPHFT